MDIFDSQLIWNFSFIYIYCSRVHIKTHSDRIFLSNYQKHIKQRTVLL